MHSYVCTYFIEWNTRVLLITLSSKGKLQITKCTSQIMINYRHKISEKISKQIIKYLYYIWLISSKKMPIRGYFYSF